MWKWYIHLGKINSHILVYKVVLKQEANVPYAYLRKHWRRILEFRQYISLGKGMTINLKKLESSSPKDALCQVWLNLIQQFWRRRFSNFVNVFSIYRHYLPLRKDVSLPLHKFEFPSPENAFCQSWLKLARWLWRRRFLNFFNVFSLFRRKGRVPSFEQIWIPFSQECFMPKLVEMGIYHLQKVYTLTTFP